MAQHLKAWIAYSGIGTDLYFRRTRAGTEVDFVVYGDLGFRAIEVKNTGVVRSQDLRPLKSFTTEYPECQPVLLYRGTDRLLVDGIWCLPGERFLRELRPCRSLVDQFKG